ncbi:MAG: outer membrane beta-barrel protein [Chitinophagaceae bacterium]|nr:outer membrane beta-barrel protein [Chitinophagaceae bacterium]
MKRILLLTILFSPFLLRAQTIPVKGSVGDSIENKKLPLAVVSFLNASDSTLASFVRTDNLGNFSDALPEGSYLMLVTYPSFADYVFPLKVNRQPINLGKIILTPKAKLLETVIVTQQAIRIKGDTTEYMADSFRVKPNANVEDLLKELPGIQVDKDGKITAQGQTVQKILVDGDEFFSDDPTIATRNLRADAVQKVQVFDKKSDQAEFSGIDDGTKQKTINLQLKDDAKKGYFGKVSAGGLDQYYNLQAMINAFKAKRKLAAFAIGSSTSETGLDWQNAGNYGFNSNNMSVDAETGNITIHGSSGDVMGSGNYNGTGLPESVKAGLYYGNKWNNDKYNLSSNYLFNSLKVLSRSNNFSQNALLDSLFFSSDSSETHSNRTRHNAFGKLDIGLDSTSSLQLNLNAYKGTDKYNTSSSSANFAENKQVVNNSNTQNQTDNNNGSEKIGILYRKKFKRKGNTFSLSVNQSYFDSKENGLLFNNSKFFNGSGNVIQSSVTDQKKIRNNTNHSFNSEATYTQPLSNVSFLVFIYSFGLNNSTREQLSFNKSLDGKYETLVDSLSNKFKYNYITNKGGINYRFTKNKVNLSFGGSISNTAFHQDDLFKDTSRRYSYVNFYPQASFIYKFSSFSNLNFNYSGSTTQPSINQIQPLVDNTDPLNVVVGNPNLKQSFNHTAQLMYTNFQVLSGRYMFFGGNFSLTQNDITTGYFIDNRGRRVTQFMNTSGNYSAGLFGSLNNKIGKSNWRYGTGPILWIYRYSSFVNNLNNITNTTNLAWRTQFNARKPNVYELNITIQPAYRSSKSTISKVSKASYWTSDMSVDGDYQLPWRLEFGSDISFQLKQKTTTFDQNNNLVLWNAYIERKFLKNDVMTLRFAWHDLLDQAKGYTRYEFSGTIQEQRYLTFGSYGLLTLTYNFVNKGGKAPEGINGIKL